MLLKEREEKIVVNNCKKKQKAQLSSRVCKEEGLKTLWEECGKSITNKNKQNKLQFWNC